MDNETVGIPASEAEAADIISTARDAGVRLTITGRASKAGIGHPATAGARLSSAGLSGISLYEPSEMVIAAHAGTPLSELEAHLAASGQRLTFEPPNPAALFGNDGEQTVGGIVAANWSGPRRIQAGACRDSLIGVRFVNGRGEVVKTGGRVMKNVTGLDLVKLVAGSWGTLGFITEVTFKVAPVAEAETTLVLAGLDDRRAVAAMCHAMGSPYGVSGAAHVPGEGTADALTLIRLEGSAFSVAHRIRALTDYLIEHLAENPANHNGHSLLDADDSRAMWVGVRDCVPIARPQDRAIWRISTAPTRGPDVVHAIASQLDIRHFYDWSGGLVWVSTSSKGNAGEAIVRQAVAAHGGYATLIRAPMSVRESVPVFQPSSGPLARISVDLKRAFDPDAILEPGRMAAGV
ncbi:FAD-binding protein [Pseudochelatococcus contaminans]|uniref:Glycolate oxidase FAD binding subunit n=1 Tax=Pseudochelatococcus contaminans TaxID=1538103 RepID=A0A7W5Z5N5_9HYPH|nr:glycolate oxidase FAD binding subunit [Pseudochelatococcus contaminans]